MQDLPVEVRAALRTLPDEHAERVAGYLAAARAVVEEDPEAAYEYAKAAARGASRVGVVREAVGIAAYQAGEYAVAVRELQAARRMGSSAELLPVIADCERALGRPERALEMAGSPELKGADLDTQAEMLLVAAGARVDLGQADVALMMLRGPAERVDPRRPWCARIRYSYADLLLESGDVDQARAWFARALEADTDEATDAADRLNELDGVVVAEIPAAGPEAGEAPPGEQQAEQ